MWRPLWVPWRWWRRAAQLALLLVFLWLFRRTEYAGADQLAGGENIFFRLDPLAGTAAMLAARQFILLFWPALVVVALTLIFGRFFCGWVCPLGTLLDYFHRIVRPIVISGPLSLWERVRVRAGGTRKADPAALAVNALTPSPSPKGRGELDSAQPAAAVLRWIAPILPPGRRADGRRVRLSVGRLRRSVLAVGARNDALRPTRCSIAAWMPASAGPATAGPPTTSNHLSRSTCSRSVRWCSIWPACRRHCWPPSLPWSWWPGGFGAGICARPGRCSACWPAGRW